MQRKSIIVFGSILLAGFSFTQVQAEGYVGASVGQADIEDVDDTSIKLFGGYRSGAFGFEAAYHDLGKQSETDQFLGTASIEVTGIELSAAGFLAASNSFDLFGKIGLFIWDADLSLTGFPSVSDDGNDLMFGFGAQFKPSQKFSIRAEYQITEIGLDGVDLDTDILSIGAALHF